MSAEAALAACEETVRRVDPDRYLSALFAPAEKRVLLFALYAFNHELARIGETVKEPMVVDIRLEWWREAVIGAREGRPRAHDVVRGLAELFARGGAPLERFEAMIAARRFDAGPASFADLAELETYADATSGNLIRIAAQLLDDRGGGDALCRHAGIAYALTGILRAGPFHVARGKSYLPRALEEAGGADRATQAVLETALRHYALCRAFPKPGRSLPAFLPASLVPLFVKSLRRGGARPASDIPLYRRQWAMLRAAVRGRV